MKLNLFYKILILLIATLLIFCAGFIIGKAHHKVVLNITVSDMTAQRASELQSSGNVNIIININSADISTLMLLPSVDIELAENIIEHREYLGCYTDIRELKNVIGMNTFIWLKIKSHITV